MYLPTKKIKLVLLNVKAKCEKVKPVLKSITKCRTSKINVLSMYYIICFFEFKHQHLFHLFRTPL